MQPKTPRADFDSLVRRAGLPLSEPQIAEIYAGWYYIEGFLERIRRPGAMAPTRGREAEPALIFTPEQG
jgi:hypothetical protein